VFLILAENSSFPVSLYFGFIYFPAKLVESRPNLPEMLCFFLDQVTAWLYFMRNGAEVRQEYCTINTIEHALATLKANGVFSRIAHHPSRDYGRSI